jgi:hypothetical protein
MQNQSCVNLQGAALCTSALLSVTLDPVLYVLLKLLAVFAVLVGNGRLYRIVGVRLDQKRLNKAQDGDNLVRWLPLIGTKQAQTHGTLVIVTDIGVVDLGPEADNRRLEGILVGEVDFELEVSALRNISSRLDAIRH